MLRSTPEPQAQKTPQDDGTFATTFSGIASKHARPQSREYVSGREEGGQGGVQTYGNHGVAAVSVAQHA